MSKGAREKETHYGSFKKINPIYLIIVIQGFLGSLITDLHSNLKYSKWRIQYVSRVL